MPGYQLYALRAALEPCQPPPRQISANDIAAARDGMSGVTGFRVVRVCHRVISNLAAQPGLVQVALLPSPISP